MEDLNYLHAFLKASLVSGQLHAMFTLAPEKQSPVPTDWDAGWVQDWSGQCGHCGRQKMSYLIRESNGKSLVVQPVGVMVLLVTQLILT